MTRSDSRALAFALALFFVGSLLAAQPVEPVYPGESWSITRGPRWWATRGRSSRRLMESVVSSTNATGLRVVVVGPERRRESDQGYGILWWIWDGPAATGPYEGAFSARGATGQYITVLAALDRVVAHKTKAAYRRVTSWDSFQGVLDRRIAARVPP